MRILKKQKKDKFRLEIKFVSYICKRKPEEKFELIATSLKNAKAVTTTPLGIPCNYFSSLKFKTI
ncbi:hypothetical protein FSS13T_09010 [Flavobacterium saliperosum S13]|uniref:Uncharacterized protein n=1 Tax=Flavobacterium saliperosum S13 TaxID=1341155 RepID=A0ABN0QHJ5_9FLAO|nr:hypothetical protein FSS13T_09010 [Flavobacterium saliperosum S13]